MCCVWFSRTGLSVRVTLLACSCSRAIFTAGQHSVTLPLHTVWSYQWQIFWLFAILQLHTQERKGWAWGLCTFNFLSNASFAKCPTSCPTSSTRACCLPCPPSLPLRPISALLEWGAAGFCVTVVLRSTLHLEVSEPKQATWESPSARCFQSPARFQLGHLSFPVF